MENPVQLAGHPVVGMSWEGFVLENLLAVLPWRSSAFFYRTAKGVEMDLLIERADGSLWAIEIKRSLSAKVERGFYAACEDVKPQRAFVVYAGDDRYYSATIILSGRRQLRWPVELVDSGAFLQGETDAWIPHQYSTIQALYETPRSRAHASERRR
nr:DUF4143 domain-containing protein [Thiothrix fructosivorans]